MNTIELTTDLKRAIQTGREALDGSSNDAEHDALYSLVDLLEEPQKQDKLPGLDSWTVQSIIYGGSGACFNARVIVTPFAVVIQDYKPRAKWRYNVAHKAHLHVDPDVGGCYIDKVNGIYVFPRHAVTRLVEPDDYEQFI